MCPTVHALCLQTAARTTRVPLYTCATQRPIGTRAHSQHVGTSAHVYTLPTAGSPTYAGIGRYATVPACASYTWAHPPTCAPYTAVLFVTSARAPVVILHRPCLFQVVNEREGPKREINLMKAMPLGIRLRNQVQETKGEKPS